MKTIKLSINSPTEGLLRQTPRGDGVWGNYKFEINNEVEECDFWVVYSKGQRFNESTRVAPENLLLITGEPEAIYHYAKGFIKQFPTVLTTRNDIRVPKVIKSQPAQPWWVGRRVGFGVNGKISFQLGFNDFEKGSLPKTKLISVITSNKGFTKGHKERIRFVQKLKDHFGHRLDVFGKGINDFDDKWDVLSEYKYHIALENSSFEHYWTEKLADSFLARCFPFYYGAPNINEYFTEDSFQFIDIEDIEKTIRIIEEGISGKIYEKSYDALKAARNKLLYSHNIFPLIASTCGAMDASLPKKEVHLKHEMSFFDIYKIPMLAKRMYFRHLYRT